MPDSKKKTVLVCGDLVWDTHVARLPRAGHNYSDPHPYTQLMNGYGGAWYLKELIDQYVKATNKWISLLPRVDDEPVLSTIEADVISPNVVSHEKIESADCPPGIATGFSVWSWHEGTKRKAAVKSVTRNPVDGTIQLTYKWPDGEPQAGAWRISEFLGCREANWNCKAAFPEACGLPGEPALLVIDDLGLGFASHPECWPTCLLGEGSAPAQILVKGLPKQGSALRNLLLAKSTWAERVTLVVSVTSLREQGAKLTHGMSWDLLREELDVVFALGGAGWPFRKCKRVVVTFGRSGAAVFSREPMAPEEVDLADVIRLERLVYDPDHLEDTWSARYPGVTFGTGSIVAAAMAVHCLQDVPPSTHLTVARALEVARANHRYGGGHNSKEIDLDVRKSNIVTDTGSAKFRSSLRSSYPRHLLPKPVLATLPDSPSLLTDVISSGDLFLRLTAEDIVVRGAKTALAAVPNLEVAKYFTVDREEIENLNAVRNLITSYVESKDTKPLSIAVFGAPGSGKSFAIKQLAEEIFGEQKATLEFNLSQFKDESDLYEAFHEVRDKSVKGQVPLVFWDEFDSNSLKWLKEFLAPMQDSEFVANGRKHPFAKCIFVFAGGTSTRFEEFDCSRQKDNSNAAKRATKVFKGLKGPDFVSRLRGFVNIKGPNPVVAGKDEVAIIRRALLFRSMIERIHPTAIDPNDHLDIDPRLLSAFLGVKEYNHGARSMEAIVSLSRLGQGSCYGPS
ncbi:MAG: hypothetical protein P4L46_18740, partial [Fimbriimonas sp.]|nr:hypothetical protein [Fimbriimonas sp.]